jgi:hypothetical protein
MKNNVVLSFLIVVFIFMIVIVSCSKIESFNGSGNANGSQLDTIQKLVEMKSDTAIWNDNGVYRTIILEKSSDPKEAGDQENEKATCSNLFSGVDRAAAKISFSSATSTTYTTFNSFRNTLQTDVFMKSLNISRSRTSRRVSQEERNVYITTSYLYAIKSESDGDLHMIIGDLSKTALTNCEVSGYPLSSSSAYAKIKAVKEAVVARFATDFCGKSSYTIFSPPVLIDVFKGSLFFDVDHSAGTVGPSGYRPTTAWEVHPISFIKF